MKGRCYRPSYSPPPGHKNPDTPLHADKLKGPFGEWIRKMQNSGKKHGVIACAVAAKLARIIYRLMKDKVEYTPVLSC